MRLEQLELRARLDRVLPLVVPVPRERAVVELGAVGHLLERLDRRPRLALGVEERRGKHRDPAAAIERAPYVLAPPVVLPRRNLDQPLYELARKLAALAQPHEGRRVLVVEIVPLIEKLLIEKDAKAPQQNGIHVGVHPAVLVQ